MKMPSFALAIAAALLLGYCWHRSEVRRAVEAEAAQRSQDSLSAAVGAERAETAARHAAALIEAQRAIAARDGALRRARAEADSLQRVAGGLVDSLASILPDSLSPFVDRLRAAWHADMAGRERERAQADSTLAVRDLRLRQLESAYDADLAAVRAQLAEAIRQLRAANARARPGLLTRALQVAPWAAGAWLAGRATR